MKKLLALVAVALVGLTSCFAFDVGSISGTWKDANWNANWTIGGDTNGKGQVVLTNAKTGAVIKTFNDSNITNFKVEAGLGGAGFSFYCKSTMRKYTFLKPLSLDTGLKLSIDRDWTDEAYDVDIEWVDGGAKLE